MRRAEYEKYGITQIHLPNFDGSAPSVESLEKVSNNLIIVFEDAHEQPYSRSFPGNSIY